ncbi:hypothetical protein PV04_05350 [Phialophora macrospora]|uniref:YbhB/YbcL family Raf kinase inhibitor-like protein n=1 Tax=Phialophora macrospora TaxID=1851006 RepID=A0A0D2FSH1_9EURO|nr:hypothetical protein PV04_05350 [Phialophora macrospora]
MTDHPVFKSVSSLLEDKDESEVLQLTIGSRKIKPGELVPKREAQSIPTLVWDAPPGRKFVVISLDLDAPFPSFAPLSPVQHWLQAGFAASEPSSQSSALTSSNPPIAHWAGPGPPPISSPHRYVFLLYEQPEDVEAKIPTKAEFGIKDRMRWRLDEFEKKAGLGTALAATYFLSN